MLTCIPVGLLISLPTQTLRDLPRARARHCRLVVVGVEVGGRFGGEAATWLQLLDGQRPSDVQAAMRATVRVAWVAAPGDGPGRGLASAPGRSASVEPVKH